MHYNNDYIHIFKFVDMIIIGFYELSRIDII